MARRIAGRASSDPPPAGASADRDGGREAVRSERFELLKQLEEVFEPLMVVLGLIFLGLLVVEYSGLRVSRATEDWLNRAENGIYFVFVGDFALRFVIAPAKGPFLRANWLTALSLAVPALRPLRAARGVAALRSVHLLRVLSGANRGMRALRLVTRGRQFAYVATLSLVVTLLGAGSVLYFDRNAAEAEIRSYGEAVWWAATLVTTINSADDPVSFEGRMIAVVMRVYAVSVFGFITASIATYFIGETGGGATAAEDAEAPAAGEGGSTPPRTLREQIEALRGEIGALREELAAERGDREPGRGTDGD